MDYWQYLEWQVVNDWQELCDQLPAERHWYFTKKATRSYLDPSMAEGDVLVFGRESLGLPDEILADRPERNLRIPTRPEVRSLNLSNTVAIASYEALRQWGSH